MSDRPEIQVGDVVLAGLGDDSCHEAGVVLKVYGDTALEITTENGGTTDVLEDWVSAIYRTPLWKRKP